MSSLSPIPFLLAVFSQIEGKQVTFARVDLLTSGVAVLGSEFLGRLVKKDFQEVLRLKVDHGEACNSLGIVMGKLGKLDEAIELMKQAVADDPNNKAYSETL